MQNKKVNQNFNARVLKAKQFIRNFDQLVYMFKTLDLMVFVNKTLKMKKNVYNLKVEIKKWKFEKKKKLNIFWVMENPIKSSVYLDSPHIE